jgi:hypothetical protein
MTVARDLMVTGQKSALRALRHGFASKAPNASEHAANLATARRPTTGPRRRRMSSTCEGRFQGKVLSMLHSLLARQVLATLAQLTVERLPTRASAWPDYFDNTDGIGYVRRPLFYKEAYSGIMLPFKGRSRVVPPEERFGIEAHITAIAFGTTRKARGVWKQRIEGCLMTKEVIERYGGSIEDVGDQIDRISERMALHQRFWKVPYHWVGLLNGDVLHNNQISRYTYHGNGGNSRLIGVAAEANLPGLECKRTKKHHNLDEDFIETNRATLRLAVLKGREENAPISRLYAHRQYSDGRTGDPGEGWWKEIGIPVAKELHLERMVQFHDHNNGREIPAEWDPEGRVNYRGRRVA